MTIPEYSQEHIGKVWTSDDDYWLITQILKLDFLYQECIRAAADRADEGERKCT